MCSFAKFVLKSTCPDWPKSTPEKHDLQVDNYCPIALASVITKVVEIILLSRISGLLETCHNQFGFKQSLGTDTCIYVLKEIVDKYRSLNGGLYMCFL